jgi:biopolymer transport protein ExbB/TolQ
MEQMQLIFLTTVITALAGAITIGVINMVVKPVKVALKRIEAVAELTDQMKDVAKCTRTTAENSTATRAAMRTMIRAFRSICYSMEEAGFNGSIKKAKSLINQSENDINDQLDKIAEDAMTIKEGA